MNRKETGLRPSRNRRRMISMQVVFVLVLGVIVARIHFVQSVFGPTLLTDAAKVQDVNRVLLAKRGSLLDRNGHELAYDVPSYMMDIETGGFSDLSALAGKLAPILHASSANVLAWLQRGHQWVQWPSPILATVKDSVVKAIGTAHASDATFTPTEERFYPYGTFAANTIGFVNHSGNGVTGLEAQYNKLLQGTNGEIQYKQDRWGFPIQTTLHTVKPAKPGDDLELTLDQTVQGFVEAQMNQLVQKYHPEHAAIIVTNPQTGGILGITSRPSFDPNQYWKASSTALSSNWAVSARFEPGSTFKVLTLAAALATHKITLNQTFMSGHVAVSGHVIHDWNYVGWGKLTFRQALEMSSNVGFAKIALRLGWPDLLHYMKVFGYLNKTGVDLPDEANSLIFPPSERGPVQLATSGFGQGIAVTPLQQMAAVGAIANGGKLLRPHLAKAVIDAQTGKVVRKIEPTVVNPQVASPDVIKKVGDTMVLDVSKGIDSIAQIPGYEVAGKTGTANTVDPKTGKYYVHRDIVSFIGYAPAQDPKVEVYVTVYWPKTKPGEQWGSTVAAPAARQIMMECLQYYHIAPSSTQPTAGVLKAATKTKTGNAASAKSVKYVQTPNLSGQSLATAEQKLKQLGLTAEFLGQKGTVKSQWPVPGVEVPVGSKLFVWMPEATASGAFKMPNLSGVSMREAGNILAAMGLSLSPKGYGFVVGQSVPPGKLVHKGEVIQVDFAPPSDLVQSVVNAASKHP